MYAQHCVPYPCIRLHPFTAPSTPELSPLSLHDALPISARLATSPPRPAAPRSSPPTGTRRSAPRRRSTTARTTAPTDRKSTRLNSSHVEISYAVFCLKKKNIKTSHTDRRTTATSLQRHH